MHIISGSSDGARSYSPPETHRVPLLRTRGRAQTWRSHTRSCWPLQACAGGRSRGCTWQLGRIASSAFTCERPGSSGSAASRSHEDCRGLQGAAPADTQRAVGAMDAACHAAPSAILPLQLAPSVPTPKECVSYTTEFPWVPVCRTPGQPLRTWGIGQANISAIRKYCLARHEKSAAHKG